MRLIRYQHSKQTAVFSSLCLLAGHAGIGAKYRGPSQVDLPPVWNHHIDGSRPAAQSVSQWWRNLNDPVLTDLNASQPS